MRQTIVINIILGFVFWILVLAWGAFGADLTPPSSTYIDPSTDREMWLLENETPLVMMQNCGAVWDLVYSYLFRVWWYDVEMLETFVAELDTCKFDTVSETNDYWICQLHYKYHKEFIDSDMFDNPLHQADYCAQKRKKAKSEWRMPRYWYRVRSDYRRQILYLDFSIIHLWSEKLQITLSQKDEVVKIRENLQRKKVMWNKMLTRRNRLL